MTEATFRSGIRSAVRGLWNGSFSIAQFKSAMKSTIERNLTQAWNEGARQCGIALDEMTDDEVKARDAFIKNQYQYIDGYANAIRENDKISKGNLAALFTRAEMWLERYPEAKANGHAMACADQKAEFFYGKTREHCRTCQGLVGRVYRYSTWVKYNAVPPHNWNFACRGGCQCQLRQTDKPLTKGKFPTGLLA